MSAIRHIVVIGLVFGLGSIRPAVGAETSDAGQQTTKQTVRTIQDVKPPFAFTITTTTPEGEPQPGVMVRCVQPRPERGAALVDLTAKTDKNGVACFTVPDANLVTDRYVWFDVIDEGFADSGNVGISPIDRQFTWTFKTLPLQERHVQVVDPQGKGIRDATIRLHNPHVFLDDPSSRSDSEGRLVLKAPPGKLMIGAVAPGFASTVLHEVELAGDRPCVITLDQGRLIEGRIQDAAGQPVYNLLVQARKEEPFHYREEFIPKTHSGADGRFVIENVSPGDWEIFAKSEDPGRPYFVAPTTRTVTARRDAKRIVLEATEGFCIIGRYVSKYRTELRSQGGRHDIFLFVQSPAQAHWQERTRADGTFDIWGLPCHAQGDVDFIGVGGFHEIVKVPQAYSFFRVHGSRLRFENVPPGTYDGIEVHFSLSGRVEGTVTDATGHPMRDVEVVVTPGYIYECDEKGRFAGEVAPGEPATLTVRKRGEGQGPARVAGEPLLVSEPFTLPEGQIVEKNLVIGPVTQPNVPTTPQRIQAPLESLDIDMKPETIAGKRVLACFFDLDQRPSRRFVQELATRAKLLEENDLPVLLIQAGQVDKTAVQRWLRESDVPFAVATTAASMPTLRHDWTVQALPWLVLLDENHAIQAAGFDLTKLDESLKDKSLDRLTLDLDWRAKFDSVYYLAEGEVLKRIAPPFIPERDEYYATAYESQASRIPRSPGQFVFRWNGGLQRWGLSFGPPNWGSLDHVLSFALQLKSYEYEGPQDLLDLSLPGDWIVRDEATTEAKLQVLEQILLREAGRDIRFVKRPLEQDVIVATGRYEFHQLPEPFRKGAIAMYAGEADRSTGGASANSVGEFLRAVGDRAGLPVVDATEAGEPAIIPYTYYRSSDIREIRDPAQKAQRLAAFLEALSTQTGLQFRLERRTVDKWFLTAVR